MFITYLRVHNLGYFKELSGLLEIKRVFLICYKKTIISSKPVNNFGKISKIT